MFEDDESGGEIVSGKGLSAADEEFAVRQRAVRGIPLANIARHVGLSVEELLERYGDLIFEAQDSVMGVAANTVIDAAKNGDVKAAMFVLHKFGWDPAGRGSVVSGARNARNVITVTARQKVGRRAPVVKVKEDEDA